MEIGLDTTRLPGPKSPSFNLMGLEDQSCTLSLSDEGCCEEMEQMERDDQYEGAVAFQIDDRR